MRSSEPTVPPRCALLACLAVAAFVEPAAADRRDRGSSALVHGVFVGELATAGGFALAFGTDLPDRYLVPINFTPLVLGPAAAYGAYRGRLDPRPVLAIHGAIWGATDLFLLGALLDGRDQPWQLRGGTLAWSLGGLGAIAGGVVGALKIDGDDALTAWMVGPPAGFAAGGLVLGGILVVVGGADGDDAMGQLATGAIIGTALGFTVAGVLAYTEHRETMRRLARFVPRVQPGADRVVLSFGGPW